MQGSEVTLVQICPCMCLPSSGRHSALACSVISNRSWRSIWVCTSSVGAYVTFFGADWTPRFSTLSIAESPDSFFSWTIDPSSTVGPSSNSIKVKPTSNQGSTSTVWRLSRKSLFFYPMPVFWHYQQQRRLL